jgi:single-stranded DNA-binding protein
VKKGDRLYVEGRIEYSQTEGEGGPKYWTDIVVNEMVMLGSGQGGGGRQSERYSGATSAPQSPTSEPDDDLPF